MNSLLKLPNVQENSIHILKESLDLKYAKCCYRIKALQNVMLTPIEELGQPNIERIKGFAIDMFLVMQKQRILLANSAKSLQNLSDNISRIENFEINFKRNLRQCMQIFQCIKKSLFEFISFFEQILVLLNSIPSNVKNSNILTKYSSLPSVEAIRSKCVSILENLKNVKLFSDNIDEDFPISEEVLKLYNMKCSIIDDIQKLLKDYPTYSLLAPLMKLMESQVQININDLNLKPSNDIVYDCKDIEILTQKLLICLQNLYKRYEVNTKENVEDLIETNLISEKIFTNLKTDWEYLKFDEIIPLIEEACNSFFNNQNEDSTLIKLLPILKQYYRLSSYFVYQQLFSHSSIVNTLNIMLGVFLSLGKQGFCIPKDLLENEEQGENKQEGEGFGLDDGTGENDASDKVESEDQLENAKKPEDQNQDKNEDPSCKEEKGIEMSENFDGEQQDLQEENDDSGESESENEMDKEMGETEKDSDKLDEQIWGDDEKQEEEQEKEDEMKNEEGKGSKDENDVHNDLDKQNEKSNEDNEVDNDEGLDATDSKDDKQSKKNAGKDIDQEMEEADEEQVNQMHNELEEPPEPEDMDLGEMNMEDDEENNKNDDNTNPFDIGKLKY